MKVRDDYRDVKLLVFLDFVMPMILTVFLLVFAWLFCGKGYLVCTTKGESMLPTITGGDVILCRPAEDIEVGEIYVYRNGDDLLVMHRVVSINADGTYVFKGDNCSVRDSRDIDRAQILYETVVKLLFVLPPSYPDV